MEKYKNIIAEIAKDASELHDITCNQKYDDKPYSFHLKMVGELAEKYVRQVCYVEEHIIPIIFGAYFHDSIEDARMTYNDVLHTASKYMNKYQAKIAADIVYALTNEKGHNRAERANEKYWEGIRNTLYAPFVKWCDKFANAKYSIESDNKKMASLYKKEIPHFIADIEGTKHLSDELCSKIIALA